MTASVVIPTRDRPGALSRCLAALAGQDGVALDVVVVDDGSREPGALEEAISQAPLEARLVHSGGVGPAAARNAGARAAERDVVLFIDDDCAPQPGWAGLLAAAIRDGAQVAAGVTVPPPGARAAVRASQAITNRLQSATVAADGSLGFAPTCNLAARRSVIAEIPFDARYPDAAGEDRDWWARVVAAGVATRYVPDAAVVHAPALDLPGFARQQLRYGRGAVRYRRGVEGERGLAGPGFYAGLVRDGFREGPASGALVLAAQALVAAGAAAERLRRG